MSGSKENPMPIVKGALFAFGVFFVLLVAFITVVVVRGGAFVAMSYVTRLGLLFVGFGLGTTVIGCALMLLARLADIARVLG
jgi:hypothetical protein